MSRTIAMLLGFIAVETTFLAVVLVTFNARIDRIERSVAIPRAAIVPPKRSDLALVRF